MKKQAILAMGVLQLLCSAAAMADDSGLYFDVSGGQTKVSDVHKSDFDALASAGLDSIGPSSLDDKGSYWSAAVGYKIFRYLAVDLGWADLGDVKYRTTGTASGMPVIYKASVSSSGPTLAAVGILPIGKKIEIQGRGGVLFARTAFQEYVADASNSDNNASGEISSSTKELFFGISGAFKFTETFAAHFGVQRFNKVGDKNVGGESNSDVVSIGITFYQ